MRMRLAFMVGTVLVTGILAAASPVGAAPAPVALPTPAATGTAAAFRPAASAALPLPIASQILPKAAAAPAGPASPLINDALGSVSCTASSSVPYSCLATGYDVVPGAVGGLAEVSNGGAWFLSRSATRTGRWPRSGMAAPGRSKELSTNDA